MLVGRSWLFAHRRRLEVDGAFRNMAAVDTCENKTERMGTKAKSSATIYGNMHESPSLPGYLKSLLDLNFSTLNIYIAWPPL